MPSRTSCFIKRPGEAIKRLYSPYSHRVNLHAFRLLKKVGTDAGSPLLRGAAPGLCTSTVKFIIPNRLLVDAFHAAGDSRRRKPCQPDQAEQQGVCISAPVLRLKVDTDA